MSETKDVARTIPFGILVKLNANNVVLEAQGRHGTTVDPLDCREEWLRHTIEANPHFNVVLLDGDKSPILMMDRSLDLVEMLPRCFRCEAEGGYLVVVSVWSRGNVDLRNLRTFCVDCHEERRYVQEQASGECAYSGHRGEDFGRGL